MAQDLKDALNHTLEAHTYDSQGRAITSEIDGGLEHYSLNYVSANRTDVKDGLNRITKYTFDTSKARNLVTQVEGLCSCGGSEIKTWVYDNQLNITSVTDALGHVISSTYDSAGNRLTETDATGTTYTYNSFGFVLTRTDQIIQTFGPVNVSTIDAAFGTEFSKLSQKRSRKQNDHWVYINCDKNVSSSANDAGWYLAIELVDQDDIFNYYLTNLPKSKF